MAPLSVDSKLHPAGTKTTDDATAAVATTPAEEEDPPRIPTPPTPPPDLCLAGTAPMGPEDYLKRKKPKRRRKRKIEMDLDLQGIPPGEGAFVETVISAVVLIMMMMMMMTVMFAPRMFSRTSPSSLARLCV